MKSIIKLFVAALAVALTYCGDPGVDISEVQFEPKIVVEGYLYPGQAVNEIKLMRNYALNSTIDEADLVLTPEKNSVIVSINGVSLQYNQDAHYYFNDQLIPEFGKPYTIKISAVIDGKQLHTTSTTITPNEGFEIVKENLGVIRYRETDPVLAFKPSPGTDFYAFSVVPENANLDNFIYDNVYAPDIKREELEEDFNDYYYQMEAIINVDSYSDATVTYKIPGFNTWFYTDYKVIVYAGDKNFKDFIITANDVQEADGNFIEPAFHFEGDGIGIFGSAVTGNVYFTLTR
jgi:hypothetical protein